MIPWIVTIHLGRFQGRDGAKLFTWRGYAWTAGQALDRARAGEALANCGARDEGYWLLPDELTVLYNGPNVGFILAAAAVAGVAAGQLAATFAGRP